VASLEPIARLIAERRALPEPLLRKAQSESPTKTAFLSAVLELGVPEADLVAIMAEHLGIPGVDLSHTAIDLSVLETIPRPVAESDTVLPLSREGARLHVAVSAGADNYDVLEELRFITGQEVSPYAAMPSALEQVIAAAYDAKDRGHPLWAGAALEPDAPAGFTVILPESRPGSADSRSAEAAQETAEEQLEELREADLEVDVSDEEEVEVEVEGGAVQARSGPARLLAVDDDFDILRMLDRTLKSAGYIVDLARDGREAEQKLKSEKYDLVVLDAMLPHVHGFEICARLKASPRTRKMPVILVSAVYRGWRYAHDARETFGADDYLEKPFHLPELLRRVEAWISGGTVAASTEKADKLYQEGIALLEDKKPAEAREVLENAVKEDPFSPRAHFALGRAMHEQGDLFHAITAYERAVELRPNLFHALRALAALYEQKGFRRKAVEAVERAVHAAPDPKTRDTMRQRLLKLL
jgi:DNA-binding response OmpR family regulator